MARTPREEQGEGPREGVSRREALQIIEGGKGSAVGNRIVKFKGEWSRII